MENMYIEKKIENALINTGMTREDIVGVRASSNAEYMKATGKKRRGKLTQNGELSYLQYGELFFLIYTIEGDVEETDHNPFIGGNSIVAVGKRPMTQNKILSYYEKRIIDSEDFSLLLFSQDFYGQKVIFLQLKTSPLLYLGSAIFIMTHLERHMIQEVKTSPILIQV